jgi:Asp-tRNA(Asn)/Glu-tRNA(Gln) amidotransferase A subunit family amidase
MMNNFSRIARGGNPYVTSTMAACIALMGFWSSLVHGQGTTFTLQEATVESINEAFNAGLLTSERLVELYLNRIEAYDQQGPALNSMIMVNPNALQTARALDAERQQTGPRGPLHGIPILLKDNFDTFDLPTTAASLSLQDSVPPDDGFIVRRLREAGAVILGKTNMDEFAAGGIGLSSLGGQTRNPYDTTRIPMGSSAGTAAAIAANFATVGFGTETVGSIRTPASAQSLVGLSPTLGLTSRDGIVPLTLNRDRGGPIARTVTDAAIMLDVIAGSDRADSVTSMSDGLIPDTYTRFLVPDALAGARIGVATRMFSTGGGDPEVRTVVNRAIETMRALGAEIVDTNQIFEVPLATTNWYVSFEYDMNRYLEGLGPAAPHQNVQDIIASGDYIPQMEFFPFSFLLGDIEPETDPAFQLWQRRRATTRGNTGSSHWCHGPAGF